MSQYDYIVVGAGSSGCAVAARLSEDTDCSVLLIEAGRDDKTKFCTVPGMIAIVHTIKQVKDKFDWGYYTTPRAETLHRKMPYTRGKVLGGSSAINGMLFVRGHKNNYDGWAAEGCEGWSFDDVLPAYKRLETYEGGESETRGGTGPVQITRTRDISPLSEAFQHAVSGTCGVDIIDDYNTGEHEGVFNVQMSAKDGLRYSTSEAYIRPIVDRPNFHLQLNAQVNKVVIDNGRAVGVSMTVKGKEQIVNASKEVILCAGVIGSPQILMLSGVGPAAHLKEHGIKVEADLPVGDNLHDHLFFPLTYLAPRAGHRGTASHFMGGMFKEATKGNTWFGRTVFESMAFVKMNSTDIPDLQIHTLPWAYPAPNQDSPKRPQVDTRPAITVQPTLIYPKSRGEVRLNSANPTDAPHIDPHYLEDPADMEFLLDSIELCREIMAHETIASEVTEELEPGSKFFDRAALRKELPNRICTVYHPVGTCRMGVDERAVVDPQLRVRGIEGLRVADASIMPNVIGGNTNAPCIMIGERVVELIRSGR